MLPCCGADTWISNVPGPIGFTDIIPRFTNLWFIETPCVVNGGEYITTSTVFASTSAPPSFA